MAEKLDCFATLAMTIPRRHCAEPKATWQSQPKIAQNVGTLMRFAACMSIPLDIFLFTDKHLKRAGMAIMYIE